MQMAKSCLLPFTLIYIIRAVTNFEGEFHMSRGGYRGGVKPTLPESLKRQSLSCRVSPEIKEWLEVQRDSSNKSLGEIVDQAVYKMIDKSEAK